MFKCLIRWMMSSLPVSSANVAGAFVHGPEASPQIIHVIKSAEEDVPKLTMDSEGMLVGSMLAKAGWNLTLA